jgi:septal ring factor EnvC (AmiA/AmiB activator)
MPGNSVRRAERPTATTLVAIAGVALCLLTPAVSHAQDRGKLDRIEGEIKTEQGREAALSKKSKALAEEIEALRQKVIGAARATQDSESLLSRLERKLAETRDHLVQQEKALRHRRKQIGGTLLVLERLSRNPPRALLLSPNRPMEVVRQAMLLRTSLPIIQNRADELREGVTELARTRDDIATQIKVLRGADALHSDQKELLDSLIERKAELLQETEAERQRIQKRIKGLAKEAKTLKELFARLEQERPAPPPPSPPSPPEPAPPAAASEAPEKPEKATPPASEKQTAMLALPRPDSLRRFPRRGPITLPVRGDLSRHYGDSTSYGGVSKGITIETRSAARVVAPYDGKVVFAGPFRGYGQILIIEHSGGYHTLLSGMERVDTSVGQWLLAGEPVGVMTKSAGGKPRLYFELRREGQPVNPLPWFAEYRGKDRG